MQHNGAHRYAQNYVCGALGPLRSRCSGRIKHTKNFWGVMFVRRHREEMEKVERLSNQDANLTLVKEKGR